MKNPIVIVLGLILAILAACALRRPEPIAAPERARLDA